MATPFVQGRLRKEEVSVAIRTACAHCDRPLHITVDSELRHHVDQEGAQPLVFEPHINWQTFAEPNIINAY
jgi:hypothetical protein